MLRRNPRSRRFVSRSRHQLSAPVATLTTVAFLATLLPARVARATVEFSEPAETPNFSDATNGVRAGADAAASTAKATKGRKAPVSAKGSFTTSVSIQVPPGRLGMTPSLALSYDSSSVAESAVGVGWSLGLPTISRSTRGGFPRVQGPDAARIYDEEAAVFTGPSGEMVPALDGPPGTGTLYMPARETSAVRYLYDASDGGSFVEHDPSGRKRYYGRDPFASTTARITNELGTHAWLLLREEDPHGNYITYVYYHAGAGTSETRVDKKVAQSHPILARVEWGGNRITGQPHAFVVQTLTENQAGPLNLLEGNTLLGNRIKQINVANAGSSTPLWSYFLDYTTSAATGKSLLWRVRRTGDAPETTTFTYSGSALSPSQFVEAGTIAPGFDDLYTDNSAWFQALEHAVFKGGRITPETAFQAPGFRSALKLIDVDGNGTTDAIYHAAGIGTSGTHVLWEHSLFQSPNGGGLGSWSVPPPGDAWAGTPQPTTGLPYFPSPPASNGLWEAGGFAEAALHELVDLDGDGDADGVALAQDVKVVPGRYVVMPGFWPPHVDTPPAGSMRVRVVTNPARGTINHTPDQLVGNWPPSAAISSRVVAESTETPNVGLLEYHARPDSDLQLPSVDLNADGKTDFALLKRRHLRKNYTAPSGGAFGVAKAGLLRIQASMAAPALGQLMTGPFMPEVEHMVHDEHAMVLVDEALLLAHTLPTQYVLLRSSAGELGLPELPPSQPIHMLSGVPGLPAPGVDPFPPSDPTEPLIPPKPNDRPWWLPYVDPEGDVFEPLRDGYYLGTGGSFNYGGMWGEFRFVPRAFMMRGDGVRGLVPEADETGSHFERSLQRILNDGSPLECNTLGCTYLPHVNFNSFFADVNGDGLPDLISAEPPWRWSDGEGSRRIMCLENHRVHLNRGYTFEDAPGETMAHTWTSSSFESPLRLVANRDRFCSNVKPLIDDASSVPGTSTPFPPGFAVEPRPTYPTNAMAQTDINGDGRIDLVLAYMRAPTGPDAQPIQQVFLNNGRGFVPAAVNPLPPDVVLAINAPAPGGVDLNLLGWPRAAFPDMARFVDLDNDGLVDIVRAGFCRYATVCRPASWYRNVGTLPDRLERIDSATGAWTTIEYASPKSDILTIPEGGLRPPATTRLVKKVRSAAGPVPTPAGYDPFPVQEITFTYENFVRDLVSNEVLGFEKVNADFVNSFDGVPLETVHVARTFDVRPEILDQSGNPLRVRHPLKGALVSTVTTSGGWISTELQEYYVEPHSWGVRIRPRRSIHGDYSPSGAEAWTAEETTSFDQLGNALVSVSGNFNGVEVGPAEQMKTVGRDFENRTDERWQIGLVTREHTVGYSEDIAGDPIPFQNLGEVISTYLPSGALESSRRVNITASSCDGPADDETRYAYYPNGLIQRVTEQNGREVTTTYDAKQLYAAHVETHVGKMVGGVFTPGATLLSMNFQTDLRTGKTTSSTDPNGATTTMTYDSEGRLLTRRGPDNTLLESKVYNDSFPLTETATITTDLGQTFQRYTHVDADGHVLSVTEGIPGQLTWSRKAKTRYDAFGRAVESFSPAFVAGMGGGVLPSTDPKDVTVYDGFDRTVQVQTADGRTTHFAYEPRQTIETNPRQIATRRTYDAFGELILVERNVYGEGSGSSYHGFVRDGRGEILKVFDADGSERRIERDGGGRIRFVTLPHQPGTAPTTFAMCHDVDDKLVKLESPAGRVVNIVRDELGRALVSTATDLNGLTVETTQTYDRPNAGVFGLGRLTSKDDESGHYDLSYDSYGRPKVVFYAPSARAKAGATNVATAYDATFAYAVAGGLKSVTFGGLPAAAKLTYTRDARGRTTKIETTQGTSVTTLAADIMYDAADRITSARYGNNTKGEWTFNPLTERLDRIAYKSSTNAVIAAVNHVYDANDNLTEENRERLGAGLYSWKLHTYDSLDRLTHSEAQFPGGSQSETYGFSQSGNILSAGAENYTYGSAVSSQAVSLLSDANKQRALTYDADGYLASDAETRVDGSSSTRTLSFDPTGCMRSITRVDVAVGGAESTSSSDYTCGLDGRVVARATTKTDGSMSRRIDFAGLAEIRPDQGVFQLRVPVAGTVSVEDARSLTTGLRVSSLSGYVLNDARGSVIGTTRFTSEELTREAEFDAWGKKLSDYSALASPIHGFVGAEADVAAGTYSFGARTYDPSLRRWVSPDPLLVSVPGFDEDIGENLNLYAYGEGNPVKNTDKTGFCPSCEAVAAAAIFGGVARAIGFAATAPTNLSAGQFALGAAQAFSNGAWEGAAAGATALVVEAAAVKAIGTALRAAATTETAVAKTAQTAAKGEARASTEVAAPKVAGPAAAKAPAATSATKTPKEGIYKFPDQKAPGKVPYVGQSGNIPKRLEQHVAAGRLQPGTAQTKAVPGGKTAREVAEHKLIQKLTGGVPARLSPNVSNKVDPIGPNRQQLLKKQ